MIEIAGAIVTGVTLVRLAAAAFARTVGLRWEAQRRLKRLSTLAQVRYVTSVLGEPVIKMAGDDLVEYVFTHRLYFVHVLATAEDESVVQYAVTTRSRWFCPKVRWWVGTEWRTVKLGKTSFADYSAHPDTAVAAVGARRFGYYESHYFGNPGMYQTYLLAYNDAGVGTTDVEALVTLDGDVLAAAASSKEHADAATRLRASRPNTYAVVAPMASPADRVWVGVDEDVVRVLPR